MFHDIPAGMRQVMQTMEEQLARDQRSLRSVDTDVARLLSLRNNAQEIVWRPRG